MEFVQGFAMAVGIGKSEDIADIKSSIRAAFDDGGEGIH